MRELVAVIEGFEVGRVYQGLHGRLTFAYTSAWQERAGSFPISLSLPLARTEHEHEVVQSFLWGLLPDNDRILEAWGRRFGVSARNPFALVACVGEECAGAVQFIRPERLESLLSETEPEIVWLSDAEVAERIRDLAADPSAWRRAGDRGQFSLAGAQPKTALYRDGDRWGIPSGRTPTTHILKPQSRDFDGLAENEHFCLELAGALGLRATNSAIAQFENQVVIVIERYDRLATHQGIVRIHQEDVCQALGTTPFHKYENQGGPEAARVVALLRDNSSEPMEDVDTFVSALALNWIIGGTDGHAKNFSVLADSSGVRLAPLYDMASIFPYPDVSYHDTRLAMKVGGEYLVKKIGRRQWMKLAEQLELNPARLVEHVEELAAKVPVAARTVRDRAAANGLTHDVLSRLEARIASHAEECLRRLQSTPE